MSSYQKKSFDDIQMKWFDQIIYSTSMNTIQHGVCIILL